MLQWTQDVDAATLFIFEKLFAGGAGLTAFSPRILMSSVGCFPISTAAGKSVCYFEVMQSIFPLAALKIFFLSLAIAVSL